MADGNAPAGPIGAVQQFVGSVMNTVTAPVDALNLGLARATLDVLKFLPKMPAARLYTDLVFQWGHGHPHPPSFGFPLPSLGPILASGCMSVLINGLPAARNGDMGLSVWCGGYFPIFEVMTGSSHVFIGGSRAARQVMDVTLHCLPDPFGGKWGLSKLDIAMAIFGVGMSALNTAAAIEGAVVAEEKASDAQGTADAANAAAAAAAAGVGAATAGAQLAADAAAIAMGLLMGKDPGIGFPLGLITMGSPNVLIGGFPMPGWMTILRGLGKLLKPLIRRIQLKLPENSRLRNALCALTGHPIDVASGRVFTTKTDFEIEGRIPVKFERLYDTSAIDYEGNLGWGWTHPYDQHLWESKRYNCLILRNEENRQVRFNKLAVGERQFQPLERIWLERKSDAEYEIFDCKNGLYYRYGKTDQAAEKFDAEENALRILSVRDRNDNRVNLTYRNNLLTEIENGAGGFVELFYHHISGKTRLVEISHHLKNNQTISLMRYGYDGDAELISATNRTYQPYIYEYENHLLIKETNRNKLSFYFEYEGAGTKARCVHTWGDGGIYERWLDYLPKSRMTRVRGGLGDTSVYHFNELDLVTKIFDANGGITEFEYGGDGELLREIDPLKRSRSYAYDTQLNRTGVVQKDGTARQIVFNEFCQPLTITDEDGAIWAREYDGRGNMKTSVNPLGARREYEYDRFGDLILYRDALGYETKYEWAAGGQLKRVRQSQGNSNSYSYNERNLFAEVIDETTNLKISYKYNDAGDVEEIREINKRGEVTNRKRFEYDAQNNITVSRDKIEGQLIYRYAGNDKIAETIDALGYRRQYKYDREERLTEFINERGESYRLEYDLLDRLTTETGFDNERYEHKYNPAGERIYQKDPLQRETFIRYDQAGRVIGRLRSDSSTLDYEYDKCGRIIEARNAHSEVKSFYDPAWQLVKEIQNGQTIEYEYDAEGRRTARILHAENENRSRVEYCYDGQDNLISIQTAGRSIQYRRDANGNVLSKILPNQLEETFDYNAEGRLSKQKINVGGRDIIKREYEWDAFGGLITIDDSLRGTRRYQYDALERIKSVERTISGQQGNYPVESDGITKSKNEIPIEKRIWQADARNPNYEQTNEIEEFRFDGDGNLTERKSNVRGTRSFSYGRGDRLVRQEKIRYVYDAAGNLIEKTNPNGESLFYEYDSDNQLIAVSGESGGRIEFLYDALGRRIFKQTARGKTGFLWDGDVLLGEKTDTLCEYIHEGFTPVARIKNTEIENFHTDYLGTPKEISAADGSVVWQGDYDEYGKVNDVSKNTVEQPFRFLNQYEDTETGLFYNYFRYYDADTGRYINQDPIGLRGGYNLYQYVDNPLHFVDVLGLQGGTYGGVRGSTSGGEVHHVPAFSSYNGLSGVPTHYSGPAIWLPTAAHHQTASWGSGHAARAYRATQRGLIAGGNWGRAMEMDINDIQGLFGTHYNASLRQAIDAAHTQGRISDTERDRLRAKC